MSENIISVLLISLVLWTLFIFFISIWHDQIRTQMTLTVGLTKLTPGDKDINISQIKMDDKVIKINKTYTYTDDKLTYIVLDKISTRKGDFNSFQLSLDEGPTYLFGSLYKLEDGYNDITVYLDESFPSFTSFEVNGVNLI
jgi:hypothetical protein